MRVIGTLFINYRSLSLLAKTNKDLKAKNKKPNVFLTRKDRKKYVKTHEKVR